MNSKDTFHLHLSPTSPNPLLLEIESAEGVYITTKGGKRYIDFIAGIGVTSVGHRHPHVTHAVKEQIDKYAHVMVYGEYIQNSTNSLAKKLASLLPDTLQTSYFVNSGTEANEAAIKLCKRKTGRTEIIAFKKSYHGNTQGSLSISGNEEKKSAFRPLLPNVRLIEFDNIESLKYITKNTAGVIIEPIQGDAGVIIPSQQFMQALRDRCIKTGSMLVFDEVQTGCGRTGKMFAFEHFNVIPDILTLAKGIGGGLPIGALVSSHENMQLWAHNPMLGHITTYGGNPVCCASALATLEVIEKPEIIDKIESKGALIASLLNHKNVVTIRQKGLMLAVELASEDHVNKVIAYCLKHGVIIYWFLSTRNSFRISPPLTISEDEIKEACLVINNGLEILK